MAVVVAVAYELADSYTRAAQVQYGASATRARQKHGKYDDLVAGTVRFVAAVVEVGGAWGEEMQEEIVRRDVDAALALDDVAGVCVWQLFDVRVDAKHWPAAKRPGGLNNKGVLSQWREPKLAAQSVQRLFRGSTGDAVSSRGHT